MKHVRLITAKDEYDTSLGFVLKGTPAFDDLMVDRDGMLIAHDLLEHQNGTKHMGPIWDELEALGGIWNVRGRHGDMMTERASLYSPAENVAADIVRMFPEWDGYNGPGSMATKAHDYDEDFQDIISHARKGIKAEYRDKLEYFSPKELEAYLTLVLHRLRTGYNKAKRRYSNGQYHGHSMFRAVMAAVASATRSIDWEGQEFRLSYGLDVNGNARAIASPIYEDGGDW